MYCCRPSIPVSVRVLRLSLHNQYTRKSGSQSNLKVLFIFFLLECVVRYLSMVQYVGTGFWVASFHTNMCLIVK